jgi:hypothetical protein
MNVHPNHPFKLPFIIDSQTTLNQSQEFAQNSKHSSIKEEKQLFKIAPVTCHLPEKKLLPFNGKQLNKSIFTPPISQSQLNKSLKPFSKNPLLDSAIRSKSLSTLEKERKNSSPLQTGKVLSPVEFLQKSTFKHSFSFIQSLQKLLDEKEESGHYKRKGNFFLSYDARENAFVWKPYKPGLAFNSLRKMFHRKKTYATFRRLYEQLKEDFSNDDNHGQEIIRLFDKLLENPFCKKSLKDNLSLQSAYFALMDQVMLGKLVQDIKYLDLFLKNTKKHLYLLEQFLSQNQRKSIQVVQRVLHLQDTNSQLNSGGVKKIIQFLEHATLLKLASEEEKNNYVITILNHPHQIYLPSPRVQLITLDELYSKEKNCLTKFIEIHHQLEQGFHHYLESLNSPSSFSSHVSVGKRMKVKDMAQRFYDDMQFPACIRTLMHEPLLVTNTFDIVNESIFYLCQESIKQLAKNQLINKKEETDYRNSLHAFSKNPSVSALKRWNNYYLLVAKLAYRIPQSL